MIGVFEEGMPALSVLLADLGGLSAATLATWMGVNRSTAHRWMRSGQAPRAVLLALYLAAPSYGHARAHNAIQHAQEGQRLSLALCEALRAEIAALRRELARVLALGDFGAANLPSFAPPSLAAAAALALDEVDGQGGAYGCCDQVAHRHSA